MVHRKKRYNTNNMKKPLDIVRTPRGGIAMITESSADDTHAVDYIDNPNGEHNAWWQGSDLQYLHNIPALLTNAMAHPFGSNKNLGEVYYPTEKTVIKID